MKISCGACKKNVASTVEESQFSDTLKDNIGLRSTYLDPETFTLSQSIVCVCVFAVVGV